VSEPGLTGGLTSDIMKREPGGNRREDGSQWGEVFSRGEVAHPGDRQGADREVMIAPGIHPGNFELKKGVYFRSKMLEPGKPPFIRGHAGIYAPGSMEWFIDAFNQKKVNIVKHFFGDIRQSGAFAVVTREWWISPGARWDDRNGMRRGRFFILHCTNALNVIR